jgi:DNA-binding winged helix-turn-helix (wHTH) protein/Tol biopolymer transport system component
MERSIEQDARLYQFGPFCLDARERVLLRDGRLVPLPAKALSTLLTLVLSRGHLVEKDVLLNEVWPGEFVEEGNLAQHIFTLRRALGETTETKYIETVPRRGYRFVGAVREEDAELAHNGNERISLKNNTNELLADMQSIAVLPFETLKIAANVIHVEPPLPSTVNSHWGVYSSLSRSPSLEKTKPLKWPILAAMTLLVAGLLGLFFFLGRKSSITQLPTYTQLTFRRGSIYTARFTSDGKGIYFSAAWNGNPLDISSMRVESPAVQSLGAMPSTQLLSISPAGEMAVLLRSKWQFHFVNEGTLARMPLAGGAPREILEHVQDADWNLTGTGLAVVRVDQAQNVLEFPIGKKLYSTYGYVSNVRVSPKGDKVAFLEHPIHGDNRGSVMVVDANGQTNRLSEDWQGEDGLAWSRGGDEVWFTATKTGEAQALYAVTLSGKQRVILRTPVSIRLHDISSDGDVLLSASHESTPIAAQLPGETRERDLSLLTAVRVTDLSPDGTSFVFNEYGQGSGANYAVYMGKTDGSPGVKLGDGDGLGRSPDGKWVISVLISPPQIVLLPTGAGQARSLERFGIEQYGYGASWLPDGKSIVFIGKEKGHQRRTYVQDINGGQPRAVTPEGIEGYLVSPDGKLLLGNLSTQLASAKALYPLAGGEPRSVPGLEDEDRVIRWGTDARSLYVYRDRERPLKIYKLDLSTGRKELAKEIAPADPAGVLGPINVLLTPDGKGYVYAFARRLTDLFLVKGLK